MQPVNGQQQKDRVIAAENQPVGKCGHRFYEWGSIIVLFTAALAFPWLHRLATWKFVLAYCVSATASLFLIFRGSRLASLPILFLLAVSLRVFLVFASPDLSGDVYRYLWDGRVAGEGINPYDHAPESPGLTVLREPWHPLINHPGIRTIYPPVAQVVFHVYGWISSSVVGWKLLLLGFDLLTIFFLQRLSPPAALAWASSPLVLVEGFWSGHLEVLVTFFLIASVVLITRNPRSIGSAAMLAAASGLKLTPIVALPVFVRAGKRKLGFVLVFVALMIVPALLYVRSQHFMSGLGTYATRWTFNSPLYETLDSGVRESGIVLDLRTFWSAVKDFMKLESISAPVYRHLHAGFVVRVLMGALLVAGLFLAYRSATSLIGGTASMIGTLLLFSPTVHPWYWMPVLALALIERQWLWILLASLSPVSYLLYDGSPAGRLVAYVVGYGIPFAAAAVVQHRQQAIENKKG